MSDDADLKKNRQRATESITDSVRWSATTSTGMLGDFAEAVASAFRTYSRELDRDAKTPLDLGDSMNEATLAGLRDFFRKLADSAEQTLEEVKERAQGKERPVAQIDYDRLAKLVAQELAARDKGQTKA